MFCRFCGKEIENDSHYCRYCGKDVLVKQKPVEPKVEKAVEPIKTKPQEEKKEKSSKKALWLLLLIPIVAFILISAFSCGPSEGQPSADVPSIERIV